VATSDLYHLVLGVLCVWRVTHLLQAEDGPWDVVVRLRQAAGNGWLGRLMDCFYCLSLWVAIPFACVIGQTAGEGILMWLAFSGGAILLERGSGKPGVDAPPPAQAHYEEDGNGQ